MILPNKLNRKKKMNDLTDNQQKVADELIDLVMQNVYTKIAHVLTDDDIKEVERLNAEDPSGNAARYFLISKVPNFDKLFKEEADQLKNELENHPV